MAETAGKEKPEFLQGGGQQANPDCACDAKAYGGEKTDISMKIKKIAGVVPVTQTPSGIKEPSNHEF